MKAKVQKIIAMVPTGDIIHGTAIYFDGKQIKVSYSHCKQMIIKIHKN